MACNLGAALCPEWVRKGFADLEALAEIFGLKVVDRYCHRQIEAPWFNSTDALAIKVAFGDKTAMIQKHGRNFWTDEVLPDVEIKIRCKEGNKDRFLISI